MTTIRLPNGTVDHTGTPRPAAADPRAGWVSPRAGKRARPFPKLALFGALALLVFAIAATIFGKQTGIGTIRNPVMSPVAIRDLVITDMPGDRLSVVDAATGDRLEIIAPNKDGFIRGAMNGLRRERMLRGKPVDAPWRLIRWDNGRLTLSDTATGQRVELDAFGKTNAAAFARFLDNKGE
jgi:putative photosynthetic complex assembly protein